VKTAYGADFIRRLNEAFAPPRRQAYAPREEAHAARGRQGPWRGQKASPTPSPELRRRGAPSNWSREASLVVAVLNHPELAERRESDLLGLHLSDQGLERLLKAVLEALIAAPALDREGLNAHLHGTDAAKTLERVLSDVALNTQTFLRPETGLDEVEKGWSDALRHHLIATEARRAMSDSAAQSFMLGEEVWKAAVNAREELVNAKAEHEVSASDRDVSSREFDDRLERMRQAVSAKKRR
jgi:DNA primase